MATFLEDDLKRQIKERNFKTLYLIYGDENYLKQHYVNLITDKAVDKDFKDVFHEFSPILFQSFHSQFFSFFLRHNPLKILLTSLRR